MQQLPRTVTGRIQLLAAGVLVLLAFAGSAAARIHGAVAAPDAAVASTEGEHGPTATADVAHLTEARGGADTFTLGDLAAGRVPQEVQDRFWQAQLDAIRTAPCPTGADAGGTAVALYLGADEAWTARLRGASEAHAAACAA